MAGGLSVSDANKVIDIIVSAVPWCSVMLQLVPPDHLWKLQLVPPRTVFGTTDGLPTVPRPTMAPWLVPLVTAGPPYNPAFITFLLNHSDVKN